MSITVRLIFWGLIGFLPNPDGQNGMTALLVDTDAAMPAGTKPECQVPTHRSVVYLLDGECDGECRRIPVGRKEDAKSMGFDKTLNGKPLPLTWLLDREDLRIVGNKNRKLKLRRPFLGLGPKIAPTREGQTSYFSWLQSMDFLTSGHGKLSDACRKGEAGCPLQARFKVEGGQAGACHLFHAPEPAGSKAAERDVKIFDFEMPGQHTSHQVIADAALLEFKAEGSSIVLLSQAFPGHSKSFTAWARLKPAQGKLTLVVANFPLGGGDHSEKSHNLTPEGCAPLHSDILFQLLADASTPHATRKEKGGKQRVRPGSCEREAGELATILSGLREPPHSATACDGRTFH